jgi:hypothetical protein
MFVDWQFARWSVDVSTDLYFFLLAGALSTTGNGPVKERARMAYQLLLFPHTWQHMEPLNTMCFCLRNLA